MFKKEKIYIAGPECFYIRGNELLAAMRKRAEAFGFGVTLPNDHPLDLTSDDLRDHAMSIFKDLEAVMLDTTVIIADLEAYRGSEADSGTIFEIGMAYAKGARCYGYTRDKRPLACKDQKYCIRDGKVYDEHGKRPPYMELPFSPDIIGSTKIIEGDFDDCLRMLMTDIEEEYKLAGGRRLRIDYSKRGLDWYYERPAVFLSGPERYDADAEQIYDAMKAICRKYGLHAYSPLDMVNGVSQMDTENPYTKAANLFDNWQQHVRNCDAIIANLNDYRGYECCNDVGFECGMAFQLGKKMYGYMDNTSAMIERVPHLGAEGGYRDMTGSNVENFDYPLNLMFSCSMQIFEGKFEEIIAKAAEDIKKQMG